MNFEEKVVNTGHDHLLPIYLKEVLSVYSPFKEKEKTYNSELMSVATSLNIHFKFVFIDNTQPEPQPHVGLFTAIHNLL